MRNSGFVSGIVVGILALGSRPAFCQMVVRAVSGTVKAINPVSHTIDVETEGSQNGRFQTASRGSVALSFDDDLRGDAVDADTFHNVDSFVVIYYYGFGGDRTAVAIKDLGKGPFVKFNGTVVGFDKHDETLSVKTLKAGTLQFRVSDKAVVDTGTSLQSSRKYSPRKGYAVRVTATERNGDQAAIFIRSRR